jgi:hypothetical protein
MADIDEFIEHSEENAEIRVVLPGSLAARVTGRLRNPLIDVGSNLAKFIGIMAVETAARPTPVEPIFVEPKN